MVQEDINLGVAGNWVDFSVNYNPFRLSNKIFKDIKINSKTLSLYPSYQGNSVNKQLAKFLGLRKENIIISNGSTEMFFLIPQVFKFRKALLLIPSFWEYEFTISLNKVEKHFIKLSFKDNFKFDIRKFEQKIKEVDCVYVCNPNNPTSTYITKNMLEYLIKKYKDKSFIIDETYLFFSKNYNKKTLNKLVIKYRNLIVVSSLSKIFGIGGIRLGFCVSSKNNIKLLKEKKNPYSLNIISELILPKILKETNYLNKTRKFISKEKIRLYEEIKKIEWLAPLKPGANFILVRIVNSKISLLRLEDYLKKYKIKIRRGELFNGLSGKYFRVCIKTPKENNLLIKALNKFN